MKFTLLVYFLFLSTTVNAQNVIYGQDDRKDLYEVENLQILNLAGSTVGLIAPKIIVPRSNGRVKLKSRKIRQDMKLCPDEKFIDQEGAAYCTGFLVSPQIIVTAGHCVSSQAACKNTKFVFDYAIKTPGDAYNELPEANIYGCEELLYTQNPKQESKGADLAIVKLDRVVEDRAPIKIATYSELTPTESELFVLGHPLGLPTKFSNNAYILKIESPSYYRATLDTYTGSSGAPVFNAKTYLVEGMLVAGEDDFVKHPKEACKRSKICPDFGKCAGELVLTSGEILKWLAH